jgi:hypothetical protein
MPLPLISNIIPAKWFIIIIKAIMLKGIYQHYMERNINPHGNDSLFYCIK